MIKYISIDLTASGGADDKRAKVSGDDTVAGFLEEKIVAGSNKVVVSTANPGSDEDLEIDLDEANIDHDALLNFEVDEHRVLDDASTTSTSLWSSTKIQTELDTKIDEVASTDNAVTRFDGTTGSVQNSGVIIDDSNNVTGINNLTIDGNLTVNGTTTSVNTDTLDVEDANITVNKGGDQSSADLANAGLTIEMSDATNAVLGYDSSTTSKFVAGESGSEVEIATISHTQTLENKTINADNNTISNLEVDNLKTGVLSTDLDLAVDNTKLAGAQAIKDYVIARVAEKDDASEITYTPSVLTDWDGDVDPGNTDDALDQLAERIDDTEAILSSHLDGGAAKHTASSITNTPSGNLAATTVQTALNELQSDIDTRALDSALDDHVNDTVGAHAASAVSFLPVGDLVATDVQSALEELDTEKYTAADFNTDFDLNFVLKDTDDLSEGSTNLYFTETRAHIEAGDISNTDFSFVNNQAVAANITGLVFSNAVVRSFNAQISVNRSGDSLYEEFQVKAIQKGADWDYSIESVGDDSGIELSVTTTGQVQYTSTNLTAGGTITFRAETTTL